MVKSERQRILISILLIFYAVGVIGLYIPGTRDMFLKLSFYNLLLSLVILILSRKTKQGLQFLFLLLCFTVGMAVEWIGIHTGWLFGTYSYGNNLGIKWFDVPVIIGINWGILSVCTCSVVGYLKIKPIWSAVLSSLLMVGLDYLIEPVAMKSDYWQWKNDIIPYFNFICWFLIAIPLHYFFFYRKLQERNAVPVALLLIMVLFFIILNFR